MFRPWVALREKIFNLFVKFNQGEILRAILKWIGLAWQDGFLLINAIFNWNLISSQRELSIVPQNRNTSAVLKSLHN